MLTEAELLEVKLKDFAGTEKVDTLNEMAWGQRFIDREKAEQWRLEAEQLANAISYEKGIAHAKLLRSLFDFWSSNGENYLVNLNECIIVFRDTGDNLGLVRALNICSVIFDQIGEYEKGIEVSLQAVRLASENENKSDLAEAYTLLGKINSRIEDYDKAIKQLTQGLELREHLGEDFAVGSSLNLIARNYSLKKDFGKAEEYYQKSLSWREKIGDEKGIPWTYLGLASMHQDQNNLTESLNYYRTALELNEGVKDRMFSLLCHLGIGKLNTAAGNYDVGESELITSLNIAEALNSKPLAADIHFALAECYERRGNQEAALREFHKFHELKEEVYSAETANKLKNQQISFSIERAEKNAEIFRLRNIELKNANEEIASKNEALKEKNKEIMDSINYAKRIQKAILPSHQKFSELIPDSLLLFIPKDVVSGDFYWGERKGDDVYFAAADCTGHGVPGALVSIVCYNALNKCLNELGIVQPAEILNHVNEIVETTFTSNETDVKDGMDIALCKLNVEDLTLEYAGANNPLWVVKAGEENTDIEEIKANKQPVGSYFKREKFSNHSLQLASGDGVFVFSDGYADQFGGSDGKKFRYKALKDLLIANKTVSMEDLRVILKNTFEEWKGELDQVDDVCIVGVRV